jgi:hypothetical protein
LSKKTERYINRKIRTLVLSSEEYATFKEKMKTQTHFLLWEGKK